jgi:hypothetical protein
MISGIASALQVFSVLLQILLIILLLRGFARPYFPLLAYGLIQLGVTVLEWVVFYQAGPTSPAWRTLYWTDEIVLDLSLFLLVIAITYRALDGSALRAPIGRLLAGVVIVVAVLPFVLFYRYTLFATRWFNATAQMLNFGAAIMNLGLWAALIGNKRRDRQLLAVSIGLGVAVAGSAISFGLRTFTMNMIGTPRELANLFGQLAHVIGVFIWCWAFWRLPKAQPAAAVTPSGA